MAQIITKFKIQTDTDSVHASNKAIKIGEKFGFDFSTSKKVGEIVSELGTSIIKCNTIGNIIIYSIVDNGLKIVAEDEDKSSEDILKLKIFKTSLPALQRLSDNIKIPIDEGGLMIECFVYSKKID